MFCRKCGSKKTTKRSAGVFHCHRCGMQPGQSRMDRSGVPSPTDPRPEVSTDPTEYVFAPRQPRLKAGSLQ